MTGRPGHASASRFPPAGRLIRSVAAATTVFMLGVVTATGGREPLGYEVEEFQEFHRAETVDVPGAGGGKAVHLGESASSVSATRSLPKGAFRLYAILRTVDPGHDGIWVEIAGQKHPIWSGNYGQLGKSSYAEVVLPGGPVTVKFLARETMVDVDRFFLESIDEEKTQAAIRAKAELEPYKELHFDMESYCFAGTKFPKGDFVEPEKARKLLGAYSIGFRYFNGRGEETTAASSSGRYAAVAEIVMPDGRISRRFRTLHRMARPLTESDKGAGAAAAMPAAMGIHPVVAKEQAATVAVAVDLARQGQRKHDRRAAGLWAGLSEMAPGDPPIDDATHPGLRDAQWWTTFKRRFYGYDKRFAAPVPLPAEEQGLNAPVVREGTLAEAGLTPEAVARIDAVCSAWAEDSDQHFAVCLVRNGVIALHKAYSRSDRRPPVSLDETYGMASISKMVAGALLTRFMSLGLVDPDAEVAMYLAPLQGVKMRRPMLVRDLYTHTAGLWGHFGRYDRDLEEQVADWAPRLLIGYEVVYNGTDMELGGKILEAISGEALPHLIRRHLFEPLGMKRTTPDSNVTSTPLEMARFGQMLLNRGAYGNRRFFGEAAFQSFLPRRLVKELGPNTDVVSGLGCNFAGENEGLGKGAFGHSASCGAIFRVCPEKNLVVVLCRHASGTNLAKHEPRFFAAVAAAVEGKAERGGP